MKQKFGKTLKTSAAFFAVLLLWQLACSLELWTPYLLPSPQQTWHTFTSMLLNGELAEAVFISMRRVLTGFSLSIIIAFLFALTGCLLPAARPYHESLLEFLRHVPPLALIPLLILWSGIGEAPKIIVIVLATFGPLLLNFNAGLRDCDPKLPEVGQVLGLTPRQIFFKIRLPAALPNIFTGLRIGLGYALRAIIGAELIAAGSGIGYLILDAQIMSRTDKALVGIICLGFLGILLDFCMGMLQKKLLPYKEND